MIQKILVVGEQKRAEPCIVILQSFSMPAFSIFYVYQKFRMHAWMQHGQRSGRFD